VGVFSEHSVEAENCDYWCWLHSAVPILCNAVFYRAMLRRARYCYGKSSVCPSFRDVEVSWSHRLENFTANSRLVSLGCSLSANPKSRIYFKVNTLKFWPKVTHPLLIWASQTFDGKLRPNG